MKNLKHLAANVVLLLYCVTASAQTFEVDGLSYTVTSTSDMTVSVKMGSVNLSGDLVIPSTVISNDKVYSVTSIGGQAFYDCSSLTSVSIPESITAVGKDAFDNTGWYTNQPDGVLYIDDWLYGYKGEMPEDFELVVKDDTRGIVDYAFEDCVNLIRVTITESTQSIGDAAFMCSGLKLATIAEGVNRIGGGAFWGCRSLTDVAIPESVTEVGNEAFAETAWCRKQPCGVLYLSGWAVGLKNCGNCENCEHMNYDAVYVLDGTKGFAEGFTNWSSVIIPESVVYLNKAFASMNGGGYIVCKSIVPPCNVDSKTFERVKSSSTLYVPSNSVTAYAADEYWGEFANIKAIDFPIWSLTAEGELIIDGVGPMENYECEYTPWYIHHSFIKGVTIKEGITTVGDNAFAYCEELASVSLPNSLMSIGEGAFAECDKLKSVVIPKNVTTIGSGAFVSAGLSSITCDAATPPVIADWATFHSVGKSIPVYVPLNSVEDYKNADYWNEFTNIKSIVVDFGSCGANLTWTFRETGELIIEGIGEMPDYSSSTIPWKMYLNEITKVVIKEGVTSIGYAAFSNCSNLINATIPEGVTMIRPYAFSGCSSLASINIPQSVTKIETSAFKECIGLTDLYIGSIDSWLSMDIYSGALYSNPNYYAKNTYVNGEQITEIIIPENITSIPQFAFRNFTKLASITIPNNVVSIGNYAFENCVSLKEIIIEDGSETLSIGYNKLNAGTGGEGLFKDCPLENVYLGRDLSYEVSSTYGYSPFYGNVMLSSVFIGKNVTSIKTRAFSDCSSLTSVTIPESVTSIGNYSFSGCSSLTSVTIPKSVTSIGNYAFVGSAREIVLESLIPATLMSSNLVSSYAIISVPTAAYEDYISAVYWTDLASQIIIDDANARVKSVALTAEADKSALHMAIGDEDLKFVTDLTVSGSINSYDFMVMRNKMPLLRHLNLKDATIVYNAYEHYSGYHTDDNKFPGYGLFGCNLLSLVLPKSITTIGQHAMVGNFNLSEITFFEGLISIGRTAFQNCEALTSVVLPKGLAEIGYGAFLSCDNLIAVTLSDGLISIGMNAFNDCENLTVINFPEGLTTIGSFAFQYCYELNKVVLPPTVKDIENNAFQYCSSLTEIRIPSSVRSVGNSAFSGCSKLNDVYVYTVEPIDIGQGTFTSDGNNFIGTLHAPKVSYWDYFYDTQWSQFASFDEFDEPYDNFYLVGDKVLDDNTGAIEGDGDKNPDAEMGSNSGIIVEDDVTQDLGNVDIEHNGSDGGSIIVGGEGCVNADELHFHINVQGGRWYFFCFPFDVRREDIVLQYGADWVFRYYDGEERASNGKGGWKNVTSDGNGNHLKAATGYIFQCSKNDVLILTAKNQKLKQEKKYNELVEHVTANMHDASWNFVGNPYLSYYEVTSEDYSAPITIWDGSKYIAIRPGDDDYQLAPFEAFFVQKPEGTANIEYNPEQQMTYHQAQEAAAKARARRRAMPINPDRLLVNITLSNGTDTDQTRVVFNSNAAMGYETTCDAAKFETAGVPQLYTIDSRAVKYAINERPVAEGIVTVGYTAPAQGSYTLAAPRMDAPICIKDNLTGTIHDFSEGSYTFMTEAGTYEDRFTVMMKAGETAIDKLKSTDNGQQPIYDAAGRRVEKMEQGVYIKNNRKVVKL